MKAIEDGKGFYKVVDSKNSCYASQIDIPFVVQGGDQKCEEAFV